MASQAGPTDHEKVVYRYICAEDGHEYTHFCSTCNKPLCLTCLCSHKDHGKIELLSEIIKKEQKECAQYSEDLDELIRIAENMSNEIKEVADKAENVRAKNADELEKYKVKVQEGLKEKQKESLEILQQQKKECLENLDRAAVSIKNEQKQLTNSRVRVSRVLANISKILNDCGAAGISKVSTSDIEASLRNHFPKIKERESHIYDRTMLYPPKSSHISSTTDHPDLPPAVPESKRPTLIASTTSTHQVPLINSLETSSTITPVPIQTLMPWQPQQPPISIVPVRHALITSIIPNAHNRNVHLSSVCCTSKGDILIADCRNASIHKLHQQLSLVIKSTEICKKIPHLLASFNDKLYILEKSPGHGFYLHIKGIIDGSCHIPVDAPNGLAVGLATNGKVQVLITDSAQEPGEFQSKIVIFSTKGEFKGEILEKHSHIKVPFGIAYGK